MNPIRKIALLLLLSLIAALQTHAQAPSVWSRMITQDDIAYLLKKSPSQIMRYDLENSEWLSPITLAEIPVDFILDDSHIFISYGRKIERIDLSGNNKTHVSNFTDDVRALAIDGNVLFAFADRESTKSLNKTSFEEIDTLEYYYRLSGVSIAPQQKRLFGRSTGVSPSDIHAVSYNENGEFGDTQDSPYHGDYPGGDKTWVFPNGSKVVDNSGTIYNTADLTYANSFGFTLNALGFHGVDIPIALSGDTLYSFSNTLQQTGSKKLSFDTGKDIAVTQTGVTVFYEDQSLETKVGVATVPLEELEPEEPGQAISPIGLAYEIDDTAIDSDGILYLLSKAHSSLFRWDTENQTYLDTIALPESCALVVYSPKLDRLYLSTAGRKIYRIDLSDTNPIAEHHFNTPQTINKMIPMGDDLMVLRNGSWEDQWIHDKDGALLKTPVSCCYDDYHYFDETKSLLYKENSALPYEGQGVLGEAVQVSTQYDFKPIAFSKDGQLAVVGNGLIFGLTVKEQVNTISNDIWDAVWSDAKTLFTIQKPANTWELGPTTTLQQWNENFALGKSVELDGTFDALHINGDQIILVVSVDGIPTFNQFDDQLDVAPPSSISAPQLEVTQFTASAAALSWNDVHGELDYRLERKAGANGTWEQIATIPFNTTRYIDRTIATGNIYQYRIQATNGDLKSDYSNAAEADLDVEAGTPLNPALVTVTVDDAFIALDDKIYILSKANNNIFVWSPKTQTWLTSIPLEGTPRNWTYSANNNAIYTAYENGVIRSIGIAATSPVELPFAEYPDTPINSIHAIGDHVLVSLDNYAGLRSLDAVGFEAAQIPHYHYGERMGDAQWNETLRRLYHFRHGTSPNDIHYIEFDQDGNRKASNDSPYHSSEGMQDPLRIHPNGSIIILGSGWIFNASNLEKIDELGESLIDASWIGGQLYTANESKLVKWKTSSYSHEETLDLPTPPSRLFATSDGHLVILSESDTSPVFDVFATDLTIKAPSILAAPQGFRGLGPDSSGGLKLAWGDVSGEQGYEIQKRLAGAEWSAIAQPERNTTSFVDSELSTGQVAEYRIRSINGDLQSIYSNILSIDTQAPARIDDLAAVPVSKSEIMLGWTKIENALAYRVQRNLHGTTWETIAELPADTDTYLDRGLYESNIYKYRIIVAGAIELAEASNIAASSTLTDPPSAPYSITASPSGPFSATIEWSSANGLAILGYRLERALVQEGDLTWNEVETYDQPGLQTDSSLSPSSKYKYRVIAFNSGGDSEPKVSTTITTPALQQPSQPSLTVIQNDFSSVSISWTRDVNAKTYEVYRKNTGDTAWTKIADLDGSKTKFVDTERTAGDQLTYSVIARNELGASDRSQEFTLTVEKVLTVFSEDFEDTIDSDNIPSATGYVREDGPPGIGKYLYFEDSTRRVYSKLLDLREGGTLTFSLRAGNEDRDGQDWSNSPSGTQITLEFWTQNRWHLIQDIDVSYPNYSDWQTVSLEIPEGAEKEIVGFRWSQRFASHGRNQWGIDNISIISKLPDLPSPPPIAISRTSSMGGVSILWYPIEDSDTCVIERRASTETDWTPVATVPYPISHYNDSSATNSSASYEYRLASRNLAGDSEFVLTNQSTSNPDLNASFAAGTQAVIDDPEAYGLYNSNAIAAARQTGIDTVLESPSLYSLYDSETVQLMRNVGQEDVTNNPEAFNLFREKVYSHINFILENKETTINGNVLAMPWILWMSTDLETWIPAASDIHFELPSSSNSSSRFFKLAPPN